MPPRIGDSSRFAAIRARVQQQTHFYDRGSKHLRFDGKQVFLHRGFEIFSGKTTAQRATQRAEQRQGAGAEIFEAIRADYDEATAERIFRAVTRSPLAGQELTLRDFAKIAREVEALGPARTAAVLNGVPQSAGLTAATRRAIGDTVNRGIAAARQNPQGPEWNSAADGDEEIRQNIARPLLKELGKAEISLNGVPVASRDEAAAGLHGLRDRSGVVRLPVLRSRIEDDAGVPLKDMRTLSLVLNRGLLYGALDQVNRQAGQPPFPLAFSPQPGRPELEIRCVALPNQPGRYRFTAGLRQSLRYVSDPKNPDTVDRLDPAKSHYAIALGGTIDCNHPDAPVTIDQGSMAYAAEVPE